MAIIYKVDILAALKDQGLTTYKLRKEKLLSEDTIQRIRENSSSVNLRTINRLCRLLNCQPGDIMEYVPDKDEDN